jgi:hypothetical protein
MLWQASVVKSGAVYALIKCVRDKDETVQRFGVLGIANLAVMPQNHKLLIDQVNWSVRHHRDTLWHRRGHFQRSPAY